MPNCTDLRLWIEEAEKLGEVRHVEDAHWRHEMGAITELASQMDPMPAVLFDKIQEYPAGYRVLTNALASVSRVALTFGMPTDLSNLEFVKEWRKRAGSFKPIPPVTVKDGPVLENVMEGKDVNLLEFPTPKWHEHDGGRYIGTGDMVITRDPETDWINIGTYRVMIQDEQSVGVHIALAHHGAMHIRKAFERNESLKVAISVGHHPAFLSVGSMEFPHGYCEYDFVGALQGEPIKVIEGPYSGLPIPAESEIVLEGEIVPGQTKFEGPFGEWTGYYASPPKADPLIKIHSVLYRNDPIILGAPPVRPPAEHSVYRAFTRAARIWDALEASGVPGVKGVWCHPAGGSRMLNIVSIEQKFTGHARQAGLIASQCQAALYANRYTIVVDDDIDPTNTFQVLWALCTRSDPATSIQIITRSMKTSDDPIGPADGSGGFASRAVIEACKPFENLKDFPRISGPSPELREEIYRRFAHVFET